MAMYVYEMEFFPGETGEIVVVPCDEVFGGATSGDDLADAVECAADWLRVTLEGYLMQGRSVPRGSFGHEPKQPGGRIIAVAVEASLDLIPAVTAAKAAKLLEVSTARVAQMCSAQLLESWKDGGQRMVTMASINARLEEQPKAGRPKTLSPVAARKAQRSEGGQTLPEVIAV